MRDVNMFFFLKKKHQKWKYYREGKKDFETFIIFLILTRGKIKKKLNSVKSLSLCGGKNRAPGILCALCIETKMKKTKV